MKKMRIFVLTMARAAMTATAYAAVPSKTTTDIGGKTEVVAKGEVEVKDEFVIGSTEDKEPVIEEIAKIYEEVVVQNKPAVEYFPQKVQNAITEKLPEVLDAKELEMNEFVTIHTDGYEEAYGDMDVYFELTTVYDPNQKIVALVGFYTGEKDDNGNYIVEWVPMDAEVTEDGRVKVNFAKQDLLKLQNAATAALAILSEPIK